MLRRFGAAICTFVLALSTLAAGSEHRSVLSPGASVAAPPVVREDWQSRPPTLPGDPVDEHSVLHVPRGLRLMVFAPHPDDESLGAGGLIQRVRQAGGDVRVVFVTNGDGFAQAVERDLKRPPSKQDFLAYGEARHVEALDAIEKLGLTRKHAVFLGFPDGGIDDLWGEFWSPREPYTSPYTGTDRPPYRESHSRRVEYDGTDLRAQIVDVLDDFGPDWVLLPDPRDEHPDHATSGVFVLQALDDLRSRHVAPFVRVEVFTYLVHYPDYPGTMDWAAHINRSGIAGSTAASEALAGTRWMHLDLGPSEVEHKRTAISRYASQVRAMERFLTLFMRPHEVFGHLTGGQIGTVAREYAARFGRR